MGIWIDHIGIACEANEVSKRFWELLGFTDSGTDENEEQGVKINFMKGDVAPQPKIELLEPLGPDTSFFRFNNTCCNCCRQGKAHGAKTVRY